MTEKTIVLLTFQLTKPDSGEPLPDHYIDVATSTYRPIW